MGSVKRQGVSSGIFIYIGTIFGFINNVFLLPTILGKAVYGFTGWLIDVGEVFLYVASFGSNAAIIRFFPYFKDPANQHRGYLSFLIMLRFVGLVIFIGVIYLSKSLIFYIYQDSKDFDFIQSYFYLLPFFLAFMIFFELFDSYASALMRPRFPTFVRFVIGPITIMALIAAYYFEYLDLDGFLLLFVFRLVLLVLANLLFLNYIGELHLKVNWDIFQQNIFQKFASYSIFSIFSNLGSKIVGKIDSMMIPYFISFDLLGIYRVFYFISIAVVIPHQGIGKIAGPMIAQAWKNKDTEELGRLYKRMALNNFTIGTLVYVGILINIDNVIRIQGEAFGEGRWVAVFLGLAQLVHVFNGYNGMIVSYSPKYQFDLAAKFITALLAIVTNYYFIQWYGLTGAAMATALTIIVINLIMQGFVIYFYSIHPFSWRMLGAVAVGLVVLFLNTFLPIWDSLFLDIFLRSTFAVIIFVGLALLFRVAPDVNQWVESVLKKYI